MKKIISLLCSLAVFLTLFAGLSLPIAVSATTSGDFEYEIVDGEVTITGYTGSATNIVIPSTIEGYPVTMIGDSAFYSCYALESVTIPDAVTSIGDYAFYCCFALESVTMGDAVETIGYRAFYSCFALESVTIPDAVTTIGDYAFYDCDALKSVTIPDAVTTIGNSAFSYCYALESVTMGDAVETIGDSAFFDCDALESVTMGDAVTTIGDYAFSDCYALKSVTIPDAVTTIGYSAFEYCTSLVEVTMGDAVETIGNSAFYSCYSLVSVTIGDAVTSIGYYAFSDCESLESVTIPDAVTTIRDYAFYECYSLREVYYPGTEAQWKNIDIGVDNEYLSSAYIHYNTVVNHWVLTDVYDEPSCEGDGWGKYTCDCGYEAERDIPATGHTGQFVETVAPTCTEAGYDVYECTTCHDTYYENEISAMGHTFDNNVCVNCDGAVADCLASAHNYASDTDQSWWVRQPGAKSISLTFSPETNVEDKCDYIYIYDAAGELFGAYTGTELAGAQITVPGDFVEIRLVSDESYDCYGFAVTDVTVEMDLIGDIDGDGALDANDATTVFYFVNAIGALTDEQLFAADLNADGVVNLFDAARLFYMVNGLIG